IGRPCPKLQGRPDRTSRLGSYQLPPPCIYVFPATIASVRNNPNPRAQNLSEVHILRAFHECFGGDDDEVNFVDFDVQYVGTDVVRTTKIRRGTASLISNPTPIRRA